MTDRQDRDVQLSEGADTREHDEQTTQGPETAGQEENPGQHGRPSDDADPGHS